MSPRPFALSCDIDLGSRIGHLIVDEGSADVVIRRGPVPDTIAGVSLPPAYVFAPDRCLVSIPDGPRFLVEGGARVTYEPREAELRDVRLILLGTVLAVLCYQRRWLPLHASAVVRDGVVHAFTAPSGGGKSTLAAELCRRGHAFFSDDILLMPTAEGSDRSTCWSGQRDLKLWRDAVVLTHAEAGAPVADMTGRDKVFARPARVSKAASGRLATLNDLVAAPAAGVRGLHGTSAVSAVMRAAYRPEICEKILGMRWLFEAAGRLAQVVDVQRFGRPMSPESFQENVAAIDQALARAVHRRT